MACTPSSSLDGEFYAVGTSVKFWKKYFFNGDMSQVFGRLCCFSSRLFLKQLASHASADNLRLKFRYMKFFLIHPGKWNIFFEGLKFFA